MHGPHESSSWEITSEDAIIFDAKNRADKISIILFWDYANEILPLTPLFLAWRNLDTMMHPPLRSFLEFYWKWWPNSWVLADVWWDLQAADILSHPHESVIWEIDTLVKVLNAHLQRSALSDASWAASQIIQLIRSRTPKYLIKHSS